MTTISGQIKVSADFRNYISDLVLSTPTERVDQEFLKSYLSGQAEHLYSAQSTVLSGTTLTLNFGDGSLEDNFGKAITDSRILFVIVNFVGGATEPTWLYLKNAPWLTASGTDDVYEGIDNGETVVHIGNFDADTDIIIDNQDVDDDATVNIIVGTSTDSTIG